MDEKFDPNLNRTQLLSSLVILSVDFSNQTSYLDHFVPFVIQSLSTLPGDEGTLEEIYEVFKNEFGIAVPHLVLGAIVKRGKRKGLLEEVEGTYICTEKTARIIEKFSSRRSSSIKEQNKLVQLICAFVQKEFGIDWQESDANRALETFVLHLDSETILSAINQEIGIPSYHLPSKDTQDKFFISQFIILEGRDSPEIIVAFENMIKGSMLATALYFPVQKEVTQRFVNTTIWLDSPVALAWLGHDGPSEEGYISSVISLAVSQGAQLGIFKHTIKEMQNLIRSCIDRAEGTNQGRRRSMAKHFQEMSYTTAEIQIISTQLESTLTSRKVRIEFAPAPDTREGSEAVNLLAKLKERMPTRTDSGLQFDVRSLIAVHGIRNSHKSMHIEDCRAILLADNYALESVYNELVPGPDGEISDLILLEKFAIMVWIKSPVTDSDFPRNRLFADALAALEPSKEVWRQYAKILKILHESGKISEEELIHYRREDIVGPALMQVSKGEAHEVKSATVDEIRKLLATPEIKIVEASKAAEQESLLERIAKLEQLNQEKDRISVEFSASNAIARVNADRIMKFFRFIANIVLIIVILTIWILVDHLFLFVFHRWLHHLPFVSGPLVQIVPVALVVLTAFLEDSRRIYRLSKQKIARFMYELFQL